MDLKDRALEAFSSLVADPSERVRARAAQQLRWLGSRAVPLLRRAVRDADRSVRLCAIRALGKVGTPAAVEALAGEFEPDDEEHLFYVLRALGFSTSPVDRAVAHIDGGLGSSAPELQAVALTALRKLENRPASLFDRVVELSKTKGRLISVAAVKSLDLFGKKSLPVLLEIMSDSTHLETLSHVEFVCALNARGAVGQLVAEGHATVEGLLEHCSGDPETFFDTVDCKDLSRDRLLGWLSSDDPATRVGAAEALSDKIRFYCRDPEEALATAHGLLENPDPKVKGEAASVVAKLSRLDPSMAAPLVLKLARETPELIYEISLVRLIEVVPEEAFEVCGRLLIGKDTKRRDDLLKDLWWAQQRRAEPISHTPIFAELSSLVDQPLPSFERAVVAELLESCGTRAVPALGTLLTAVREAHERRRICEALVRLRGAPAYLIPVLTDLLFEFQTSEAAAELLVGMDRSARADLLEKVEARMRPAMDLPAGVFTLFARLSPERLERWIELGLKARKPIVDWVVAMLKAPREEYELHLRRESVGRALHAIARCRPDLAARPGFVGTLERRALAGDVDRSEAVRALGRLLPDTLLVFTKLLSLTRDSRHRKTIFEALIEAVRRLGPDAPDPLIDLALLCLDGDGGRYLVESALDACRPRVVERILHVLEGASPRMERYAALLIRLEYIGRRLEEAHRFEAVDRMICIALDPGRPNEARLEAIKGCARLVSGVIDRRENVRRDSW